MSVSFINTFFYKILKKKGTIPYDPEHALLSPIVQTHPKEHSCNRTMQWLKKQTAYIPKLPDFVLIQSEKIRKQPRIGLLVCHGIILPICYKAHQTFLAVSSRPSTDPGS